MLKLPAIGVIGGSDGPTSLFIGGGSKEVFLTVAAVLAGASILCAAAGFLLSALIFRLRKKNR